MLQHQGMAHISCFLCVAGWTQQCREQPLMTSADTLSDQGSGMRVLQRSSMILSRLPLQMTTQLFACAFKRAAKAGEALFVTGDRGDGCYRVEQGLARLHSLEVDLDGALHA